jgi:integrase
VADFVNKYRQQSVSFRKSGVLYNSVVLSNIETDAIHVSACAYLFAKSKEGASPNTLNSYAPVLKSLIEEVEADPEIRSFDDLTDAHMTQYLEAVLYHERGVSASTINFHIAVLKSWFNWCYKHGYFEKPERFSYYVNQYIKLQLKKATGRASSLDPFKLHHKYIPPSEFDELMRFESSKIAYSRARNELILRLGYQSGLRASEVVSHHNLSFSEIKRSIQASEAKHLTGFEIDIIGKGPNGGKVRTIYVPDDLKRKIERFIKHFSEKLKHRHLICAKNGSELNSTYASKVFRDAKTNLIANAETPVADRWENLPLRSFHSLRHSYATNLARRVFTGDLKGRVPRTLLQERLGHTNPSTSAIYIHFSAIVWNDHIEIQDQFAKEIQENIIFIERATSD